MTNRKDMRQVKQVCRLPQMTKGQVDLLNRLIEEIRNANFWDCDSPKVWFDRSSQ